jgi:hypothetical protein
LAARIFAFEAEYLAFLDRSARSNWIGGLTSSPHDPSRFNAANHLA